MDVLIILKKTKVIIKGYQLFSPRLVDVQLVAKQIDFKVQNVIETPLILFYITGNVLHIPMVSDVEPYYCEKNMKIEFKDMYPQIC